MELHFLILSNTFNILFHGTRTDQAPSRSLMLHFEMYVWSFLFIGLLFVCCFLLINKKLASLQIYSASKSAPLLSLPLLPPSNPSIYLCTVQSCSTVCNTAALIESCAVLVKLVQPGSSASAHRFKLQLALINNLVWPNQTQLLIHNTREDHLPPPPPKCPKGKFFSLQVQYR